MTINPNTYTIDPNSTQNKGSHKLTNQNQTRQSQPADPERLKEILTNLADALGDPNGDPDQLIYAFEETETSGVAVAAELRRLMKKDQDHTG